MVIGIRTLETAISNCCPLGLLRVGGLVELLRSDMVAVSRGTACVQPGFVFSQVRGNLETISSHNIAKESPWVACLKLKREETENVLLAVSNEVAPQKVSPLADWLGSSILRRTVLS